MPGDGYIEGPYWKRLSLDLVYLSVYLDFRCISAQIWYRVMKLFTCDILLNFKLYKAGTFYCTLVRYGLFFTKKKQQQHLCIGSFVTLLYFLSWVMELWEYFMNCWLCLILYILHFGNLQIECFCWIDYSMLLLVANLHIWQPRPLVGVTKTHNNVFIVTLLPYDVLVSSVI